MRRPLTRSRLAGLLAAGLALLTTESTTLAQARGGESSTMARYIPKDNLLLCLEYDGLDAQADAWRKTAAYKILNNTPTGSMLEDLFLQCFSKIPITTGKPGEFAPASAQDTADLLGMIKHVARSGMILAFARDPEETEVYSILVFRDVFKNKDVRQFIARGLGKPANKPQAVVRAGHKVITVTPPNGRPYTWWIDDTRKEDLVWVIGKTERADLVLETLDGKRPSFADHPDRAELMKVEKEFTPTGFVHVNPVLFKSAVIPNHLGLSDIAKFDVRWGFQDNALMNIVRIQAPSPRKGALALFDGPTFTKKTLPPLPESVTGFTVMSIDLKSTMDQLIALAKQSQPDAEDQVNKVIDTIKTKTKLRLREDILSHLGPRAAWYVLPGKSGTNTIPASPTAMSMALTSLGVDQIPRLAIVLDIDSAPAFGKVLDELMNLANREIKAYSTGGGGGGGEPGTGRGNRTRGGAAGPPTFEFRLMPGETKAYVLNVPPEAASLLPSTFRPTIRVGPKNVAIAVSPDLARLALEAKGSWTAPTELAGGFLGLPEKLRFLSVSDPRDTTPALLAALPAKLQTAINTAILQAQPVTPPVAGAGAGPGPGMAGAAGGPPYGPGGPGGPPGGRGRFQASGPGAGGDQPGGGPMPAPGSPGPNGAPAPPQTIVLQVDAAKLPSADAIRALLFPSITSAEVTDEGIRFVVRQAFPALGDPAQSSMISGMLTRARTQVGPPLLLPPPGMAPPGMAPPRGNEPNRPGPDREPGKGSRGPGAGPGSSL